MLSDGSHDHIEKAVATLNENVDLQSAPILIECDESIAASFHNEFDNILMP